MTKKKPATKPSVDRSQCLTVNLGTLRELVRTEARKREVKDADIVREAVAKFLKVPVPDVKIGNPNLLAKDGSADAPAGRR